MSSTLEQAFVKAGYKPLQKKKARPRKIQKCHRCGAPMEYIEETNILVCTGDVEIKDDEGNLRTVACNNRFLFSNH